MNHKYLSPLLVAMLSTTLFADESDTVTLQFNWPDVLEGSVDYSYETIKQQGGSESVITLTGTSDIRATKSDGSYTLDSFNHVIHDLTDDGSMSDFSKQLMEKIGSVSTTAIISPDGVMESVTGMESVVDDLKKELINLTADLAQEVQASLKLMVDDALSDEKLLEQAQTNWDSNVGQWIGAELESGFVYEVEYGTPIALLDNQKIPTKGFYRYLGPVKCTEASETADCANLNYTSELDADVTSKVLDLIYERWQTPRPEGIRLAIEYEVTVITDPDTLVPYQTRDVTRIYNPDPESGKQNARIKTQTSVYRYTQP